MQKKLKVVELFAGVGGFRLGLEKSNYKINECAGICSDYIKKYKKKW